MIGSGKIQARAGSGTPPSMALNRAGNAPGPALPASSNAVHEQRQPLRQDDVAFCFTLEHVRSRRKRR